MNVMVVNCDDVIQYFNIMAHYYFGAPLIEYVYLPLRQLCILQAFTLQGSFRFLDINTIFIRS